VVLLAMSLVPGKNKSSVYVQTINRT